jgi:hypothetical protein
MEHAARHLHARAVQWLSELPPGKILEPAEPPKVKRTGDPAALVASLREQIAETQQEARQIAVAPLPAKDLRRAVREQVTRLAALARPVVNPLTGEVTLSGQIGPQFILAALCAMAPGSTTAVLNAQVDRLPDDGLDAAAKAARLKELRQRLDGLERQEESALLAALAAGHSLHRRPDASVPALLNVRVVSKAKAAAQAA